MIERFLKQTTFTSVEDYNKNLEFIIPENFNFAYDVMDVWAEEKPEGLAILWTNDQGEEIRTTFAELKEQTDQALPCVRLAPSSSPQHTCSRSTTTSIATRVHR